jgi:hypothetical protein
MRPFKGHGLRDKALIMVTEPLVICQIEKVKGNKPSVAIIDQIQPDK